MLAGLRRRLAERSACNSSTGTAAHARTSYSIEQNHYGWDALPASLMEAVGHLLPCEDAPAARLVCRHWHCHITARMAGPLEVDLPASTKHMQHKVAAVSSCLPNIRHLQVFFSAATRPALLAQQVAALRQLPLLTDLELTASFNEASDWEDCTSYPPGIPPTLSLLTSLTHLKISSNAEAWNPESEGADACTLLGLAALRSLDLVDTLEGLCCAVVAGLAAGTARLEALRLQRVFGDGRDGGWPEKQVHAGLQALSSLQDLCCVQPFTLGRLAHLLHFLPGLTRLSCELATASLFESHQSGRAHCPDIAVLQRECSSAAGRVTAGDAGSSVLPAGRRTLPAGSPGSPWLQVKLCCRAYDSDAVEALVTAIVPLVPNLLTLKLLHAPKRLLLALASAIPSLSPISATLLNLPTTLHESPQYPTLHHTPLNPLLTRTDLNHPSTASPCSGLQSSTIWQLLDPTGSITLTRTSTPYPTTQQILPASSDFHTGSQLLQTARPSLPAHVCNPVGGPTTLPSTSRTMPHGVPKACWTKLSISCFSGSLDSLQRWPALRCLQWLRVCGMEAGSAVVHVGALPASLRKLQLKNVEVLCGGGVGSGGNWVERGLEEAEQQAGCSSNAGRVEGLLQLEHLNLESCRLDAGGLPALLRRAPNLRWLQCDLQHLLDALGGPPVGPQDDAAPVALASDTSALGAAVSPLDGCGWKLRNLAVLDMGGLTSGQTGVLGCWVPGMGHAATCKGWGLGHAGVDVMGGRLGWAPGDEEMRLRLKEVLGWVAGRRWLRELWLEMRQWVGGVDLGPLLDEVLPSTARRHVMRSWELGIGLCALLDY